MVYIYICIFILSGCEKQIKQHNQIDIPEYTVTAAAQIQLSEEKETFALQNQYYDERERLFAWAAAQANRTVDVVFLGDSITQKFEWADFFPGLTVANRGIGSDTTAGALARLDSVTALKPSVISCMLGINDISQERSTEDIVQSYRDIFAQLKENLPDTHIIVTSVLPVTAEHPIHNEAVIELNTALAQVCEEENVTFLDLYSAFIDDAGNLRAEYALDDVHLTAAGYALWLESLVPEIYDVAS